jgi:hypothetical protein
MYKLKDEPQLLYSMLLAMDGNQSLKLVDYMFRSGTQRSDDRAIDDPRWLTQEEVDVYKDEVSKAKTNDTAVRVSIRMLNVMSSSFSLYLQAADDEDMEQSMEKDGESGEFAWVHGVDDDAIRRGLASCADRWRNAGPEARKKMFALFAASGIFLVVCRHGHVLVLCDMIRSGEL